jgi:glycosyltransferase involved in cell wall biosynthesis
MRHVVINNAAQEQLSFRKGISSLMVPNVFNFQVPPPQPDEYTKDIRKEIGLAKDDFFILQPTRVVPRKGIEHAIKLVAMLNNPKCKLVISHDAGDEGMDYADMLYELAEQEGVDLRIIATRVGEVRQLNAEGNKIYTLWDIYPHADLVTYPSLYEGFGNALLEAIYFKKPVVINRYSIFIQDIEPKGFKLAVMDGFVTSSLIKIVDKIMNDKSFCKDMVEHNYEVANQFYGYDVLKRSLQTHLTSLFGNNV